MKSSCFVATFIIFTSCATIKDINYIVGDKHTCEGILEKHTYECSVPGTSRKNMYVYLPKSYYDTDERYPVLYLLHGANGNESSWIIKGNILSHIDSLIADESLPECIYIFPNMNHYHNDYDYGNSREIKSIDAFLSLNGSVEHAFCNDVISYVDSSFRTIPQKQFRAIAGLSLGGLQTIYITSNNPDKFGYIGLFSPLVYPPPQLGKYGYIYRELENKLKEQFSFPPFTYWIMVGKEDIYFNSSDYYNRLLTDADLPHRFYISDGGHTWRNWSTYVKEFIKVLWKY